eukprot:SAG11_NODE_2712_length_3053_cov_2.161083_3_plen_132_part_00
MVVAGRKLNSNRQGANSAQWQRVAGWQQKTGTGRVLKARSGSGTESHRSSCKRELFVRFSSVPHPCAREMLCADLLQTLKTRNLTVAGREQNRNRQGANSGSAHLQLGTHRSPIELIPKILWLVIICKIYR